MAAQAQGPFDYVVVGAGSAGCALAARLSEEDGVTVALLEAGPPDTNPWIHVPAGYYRTIFNPAVTWQFAAGPEPHLAGRTIPWPRGRVLGGTSAINGLAYVRGQAEDFDHWRQLGNAGWSYSDVLPYFRRAEDQERGADAFHGAGGPLGVSDIRLENPLCEAYIAACEAVGIPRNRDFNGAKQEGVGYFQFTTRDGRRCSTAVGYLRPARRRSNLTVLTGVEVTKLVLEGRRVTGVACEIAGDRTTVSARREVLLAAGAIGSPQLLLVSGIGPGAVLAEAGVAVRHDLPGVGENLQDHFQVRFIYECNLAASLNNVWHSRWRQLRAGVEYAMTRRGILTMGAGLVGVFARTHEDLETPDVQIHFIPFSTDKPGQGLHPFSGVTASVCQLRPDSRGRLSITSPDPRAKPRIVANYLATEHDRDVTVAGMHLLRRIASAPPFSKHVVREHTPGPGVASDFEMLSFARSYGTTIYHPCGTCKMGRDAGAVVDERLRVHGLEGLRVIDAAIMPTMVSGNTNAATIMIGEKGADLVLDDARSGALRERIGTAA